VVAKNCLPSTCVLTNIFASVLDFAVYGVRWVKFAGLTIAFISRQVAIFTRRSLQKPDYAH
jgi:hypothetical protein